jgi:hypothetical protein
MLQGVRGVCVAMKNGRIVHKAGAPAQFGGSLHALYVRCGTAGCRCVRGELHGPYWRHQWRENGRTRRRYVRQADVPRVRAELVAWRAQHPTLTGLRRQLTELRRLARLLEV